jgi:hypothetical protein
MGAMKRFYGLPKDDGSEVVIRANKRKNRPLLSLGGYRNAKRRRRQTGEDQGCQSSGIKGQIAQAQAGCRPSQAEALG